MNKIIKKFLLAVYQIMIEMHLKEPLLTDIFCEPFTKNIERIKILKKFIQDMFIESN